MKTKQKDLDNLLELQGLLLENRKLELGANRIKEELVNDSLRVQMLEISQQLNAGLTHHEELQRDLRRLTEELELVSKRAELDRGRLNTTAVPREAIALQHEIETLQKRSAALSEQIAGLNKDILESSRAQHELQVQRDHLEVASDQERERAKLELAQLRTNHQENRARADALTLEVPTEIYEYFQRRFARGVAIGRLKVNACGACNMNLNSAAMIALHNVPADEMASCPECQAILIR